MYLTGSIYSLVGPVVTSALNLFFLTKNNKEKNLDLKKYFILNFNLFSENGKKLILNNYN